MTEPTLKDLYEIVVYLKNNSATKADLQEVKDDLQGVKDDLQRTKNVFTARIEELAKNLSKDIERVNNNLLEHADYVIGMHKRYDSELTALVSKQLRHDKHIDHLHQYLGLKKRSM